jgi:hypothetical protein
MNWARFSGRLLLPLYSLVLSAGVAGLPAESAAGIPCLDGDVTICDPPFDPPASAAADRDHAREFAPPSGLYERLERMRAGKAAAPTWGGDVLMTPGDSLVRNVLLDFDVVDGSFYGFIWHTGVGGHEGVKILRSVDDGLTWQSRGSVYYSSMIFADADFVYCDSAAVVVMAGTLNGEHRLWSAVRGMPPGTWSFPAPFFTSTTDSIKSIALATDYDNYVNAPYIYLVAEIDDEVHFWRSLDKGQTWTSHTVLVTGGAWAYPDVAYGWSSGGDVYVAYNKQSTLYLARNTAFGSAAAWTAPWQSFALGSGGCMPAVAAIRDSIQVIFNRYVSPADNDYIAVRASTDRGANWYGARLSWAEGHEMMPDLTARGDVFRAAWMLTALPNVVDVHYARCLSTAGFEWEPSVVINDHDYYWDQAPFGNPCVEYLPRVGAGVAYTGHYENRRAWVDFVGAPWVAAEPRSGARPASLLAPVANPVLGTAEFRLSLPSDAEIRLELFDVAGRRVAILCNGRMPAGDHAVTWEPGDRAAGIYFARLGSHGAVEVLKLVLIP